MSTFDLPDPGPVTQLEQQYLDLAMSDDPDDLELAEVLAQQIDGEADRRRVRLARRTALAQTAVWYAQQGIPVFPCQPRGKQPFPGSRGFKDASADPELVSRWWRMTPDANIAAPTGIMFDVTDLDGTAGVLAWARVVGDQPLPTIGHVITPRGGGHHLYTKPSGRGNMARKFTTYLPGVDFRGAGGYVLLPPSFGENGRQYRWAKPLTL